MQNTTNWRKKLHVPYKLDTYLLGDFTQYC